MAYSHLTTDEETEILRLLHEGWDATRIARRLYRSRGAVQKVIIHGHVRTPAEILLGMGHPPPTLEEIEERKREIRIDKGEIWESDKEKW